MTVAVENTKFVKSEFVSDTISNGGRASHVEVIHGAKNNLFPRVTKSERTNGITRYRKEFFRDMATDDEPLDGVKGYIIAPSNGGDRFAIGLGTQGNTQGDWLTTPPLYTGCGQLQTALTSGEISVTVTMEGNDFEFIPGGFIRIANNFHLSQTIGTGVVIGDSVQATGDEGTPGTWNKIAADRDVAFPKGIYIGNNTVVSTMSSDHEEFLNLNENKYTDEVIGTGDGASATPTLTNLANPTNGLVTHQDYLPVVTATAGGQARTVNIAADGTCSGYCSAGELNMVTGVWTTPITWATAPDDTTDIMITYYRKNYFYSGNDVTLELTDSVANAYATDNTYVSGCIGDDDYQVAPASENWTVTSTGGTYDDTTYPLGLHCDGTEEDSWTITFTSATTFTCSGIKAGSVGTGSVGTDFTPTNPETGQPFFTLQMDGWGGVFTSGDTVTFQTHPAAFPIIWREIVPVGCPAQKYNLVIFGMYWE